MSLDSFSGRMIIGFSSRVRRQRRQRTIPRWVTPAVVALLAGLIASAITELLPVAASRLFTSGDQLVGRASVIDGDTIEIAGTRIRLNGIDAPESRQTCSRANGSTWRCGQHAARALDELISAQQPVYCDVTGTDRYGRAIADCRASDIDLADWLVRNGLALDWPRYSGGRHQAAQREASEARRGIWQGKFTEPWVWRRRG